MVKAAIAGAAGGLVATHTLAQETATPTGRSEQPNIVVIMGDDIGYWNTSVYHHGIMGTRTPNIDRIAAEGDDRQLRAGELHGRPGGLHHRADRCGPGS